MSSIQTAARALVEKINAGKHTDKDLQALVAAVNECDVENKEINDKYRAAAQEIAREGEIEVDDGAVVSLSEDGAYVQAWLWVNSDVFEED